MTCALDGRVFEGTLPISTLVLVDMCKANLPRGLRRSPAGTVVQNCRRALSVARFFGWRVAHVRSTNVLELGASASISGFEPDRLDAKFERRALSCYSSPYFQSVMRETAGSFVLAGFLGEGGALATVADSIQYGDNVTLLADASLDDASSRAFTGQVLSLLATHTALGFNVVSTSGWLRMVEVLGAPLRALRLNHQENQRKRSPRNGTAHP